MPTDVTLPAFIETVAAGDRNAVAAVLRSHPEFAVEALDRADERFHEMIGHQLYAGDTALHVAAAAYYTVIARELATAGADIAAVNRRGAQPLHCAVRGGPGAPGWDPAAQRAIIACLVALGADPDARDKTGTTPLLRAVRNRCADAVDALLEAGADPHRTNKRGSTAMDLAGWTTGRGGTGTAEAKAQQERIVAALQAADVR